MTRFTTGLSTLFALALLTLGASCTGTTPGSGDDDDSGSGDDDDAATGDDDDAAGSGPSHIWLKYDDGETVEHTFVRSNASDYCAATQNYFTDMADNWTEIQRVQSELEAGNLTEAQANLASCEAYKSYYTAMYSYGAGADNVTFTLYAEPLPDPDGDEEDDRESIPPTAGTYSPETDDQNPTGGGFNSAYRAYYPDTYGSEFAAMECNESWTSGEFPTMSTAGVGLGSPEGTLTITEVSSTVFHLAMPETSYQMRTYTEDGGVKDTTETLSIDNDFTVCEVTSTFPSR